MKSLLRLLLIVMPVCVVLLLPGCQQNPIAHTDSDQSGQAQIDSPNVNKSIQRAAIAEFRASDFWGPWNQVSYFKNSSNNNIIQYSRILYSFDANGSVAYQTYQEKNGIDGYQTGDTIMTTTTGSWSFTGPTTLTLVFHNQAAIYHAAINPMGDLELTPEIKTYKTLILNRSTLKSMPVGITLATSTISLPANGSCLLGLMEVHVNYSDKTTKTVSNVNWELKNGGGTIINDAPDPKTTPLPGAGFGAIFKAPAKPGKTVLTCVYFENGKTFTTALTIHIFDPKTPPVLPSNRILSSIILTSPTLSLPANGTYSLSQMTVTAYYVGKFSQVVSNITWSIKSGGGTISVTNPGSNVKYPPGTVLGTIYTAPDQAANVILTCSYTEMGVTQTVDLAVIVAPPIVASKALSGISLLQNAISVPADQSYPMANVTVIANYSDKTTQTINNAVWCVKSGEGTLSPPILAVPVVQSIDPTLTKLPAAPAPADTQAAPLPAKAATGDPTVFTAPANTGITVLTCTYSENGVSQTCELTITIVKRLVSLSLNPASISVPANGTFSYDKITVTACYSDNTTQNVTNVTWGKPLTGQDNLIFMAPANPGSYIMPCTYFENTQSVRSDLTITVN
ncbi:MAG: hypothetical protein HQM09_06005 [Candidatus Riflebacteria bacterium]|nr:hypothetical protein [Candidatus Riflebacteria bacterium]